MTTKTKFGLKGKSRDSYLELVLAFPLASITSDEHLEEAQEVMDRLLAKGRLDQGEKMYLDALSDLVASAPQDEPRQLVQRLISAISSFRDGHRAGDDTTLMVVRRVA